MKRNLAIFFGGLIFGLGLAVSGMTKPEVVLSFLQLSDLGLLLVMGFGILVAMFFYHAVPNLVKRPVLGGSFQKHGSIITKPRLFGAVLFGVGWGLSGICPGSALASIGTGNYPMLLGLLAVFVGAYVQGRWVNPE